VIVKQLNEKAAMAIALIENIQREDLNPLEEAEALKKLLDNFQMTHQQLADAVGKSRAAVTNFLRLLDLSDAVKSLIFKGQLSMGHARALLTLEPAVQQQLANKIIQQGLTVRGAEMLAKQAQSQPPTLLRKIIDRDTLYLQQQISEKLNAKVEINHKKNGSGQLVINYTNLEELDGILQKFS
jgi:ParB family chromosome partitioning protein